MKLPNICKTYIKSVKQMRRDYAEAKSECLKILETNPIIGMADEKILKQLAENLRVQDKQPNAGQTYWVCSTQLRDVLSEQSMETFKIMNDATMQAIFWDDRVPDENGHCNLPPKFY